MDDEQRYVYFVSLAQKLRKIGFEVYITACKNYMFVSKPRNDDGNIAIRLHSDSSLFLVKEFYAIKTIDDIKQKLSTITNIKIDEPHCDNLEKITKMYFEMGKGANGNNPPMEELLDCAHRTKSARNI